MPACSRHGGRPRGGRRDRPADQRFPARTAGRGAALFSAAYRRASEAWPEKARVIEEELSSLGELERRGEQDPDAGARCFGRLMGELFVYRPDDAVWAPRLRRFGEELGEFIYIMDAVLDLGRDAERGSYNPLAAFAAGKTEEELHDLLTMLIGECAAVFELLPVVQDAGIMRNILYSGVWTRYNAAKARSKKGEKAGES